MAVLARVFGSRSPTNEAAAAEERLAVASQLQLTWWRFRRHKLACISGVVVILFYLVVIFADFLAYADPHDTDAKRSHIPPQGIHLFDNGAFRPFVYGLKQTRDPRTFKINEPTLPVGGAFTGFFKPTKICQGPNVLFVLDYGDSNLARTDSTKGPGFLRYNLTGGAPTFVRRDTSIADARGIAADQAGNVYVSCIAREFISSMNTVAPKAMISFAARKVSSA